MPDELTLSLRRQDTSGSDARRAIRDRFGDELGRDRTGELSLVVSELVTNAVLHGRGSIALTIRVGDDGVYGEVVDDGAGFEREVRERGPDELSGRGLSIVDALTRRWGVHEGTTHVWFELAGPDEPPRHSEPKLGKDERPDGLDAP